MTDTDPPGSTCSANDRSIVAVRVNGELRDLHLPLSADEVVEPIKIDTATGWPSCGIPPRTSPPRRAGRHPDAKLGIGPPITDGFYYDFDIAEPFTPRICRELERR